MFFKSIVFRDANFIYFILFYFISYTNVSRVLFYFILKNLHIVEHFFGCSKYPLYHMFISHIDGLILLSDHILTYLAYIFILKYKNTLLPDHCNPNESLIHISKIYTPFLFVEIVFYISTTPWSLLFF